MTGISRTDRIIKQFSSNQENRTPIATEMFLPNHSGDHSKGRVLTTPTTNYELANKKYVDDQILLADHGNLVGLADDDHTQYALLAGRSGGQVLIGGTASGNNLTLQSTSHATKGKILFGTSAYDEVNNRLGIGKTTPGDVAPCRLELYGTSGNAAGPHITATATVDTYPLLQILNWTHDNVSIQFDSYFNGTSWLSSDVGSNFQIIKYSDLIQFRYDSAIAAGSVLTWNAGIAMDVSGNVEIGTVTAPVSKLTIVHSSSANGFNLGSVVNTGLFMSAFNSAQAILAGGVSYNGTNFTARSTSASMITQTYGVNSEIRFYQNLSLTAGSTYTPTERWRMSGAVATLGNLSNTAGAGTAYIHLKAGTATASTAPLKFTSGTNLTTPEAGAVEWNGTNLFITQSDGTRKTIAYV